MSEGRQKLTISHVGEPQAVGDKGAQKVTLKAKGEDGKELQYYTFSKSLVPFLKIGETVEALVTVSQREVGDAIYTDRKITEIYIDGQPVSSKGQGGKPGFQPYQQRIGDPAERASIEAQVAVKAVTELLVAKVVDLNHPWAKAAVEWAIARLGGGKSPQDDGSKKAPEMSTLELEKVLFPPAPTPQPNITTEPHEEGRRHPWLTTCPEHNVPWEQGKWGPEHKYEKGVCVMRQMLISRRQRFTNLFPRDIYQDIDQWVRGTCGRDWKHMGIEEQVGVIERLSTMEGSKNDNPKPA